MQEAKSFSFNGEIFFSASSFQNLYLYRSESHSELREKQGLMAEAASDLLREYYNISTVVIADGVEVEKPLS